MYYKTIIEGQLDIGCAMGAPAICPVTGAQVFPVVWVTPAGHTRYDLLNASQVGRLEAATPAQWEEACQWGLVVARRAQAKADAQRYGVLIATAPVSRASMPIRGSGAYSTLTAETLAAVEARADGRQVADFVADGKRAP